MYTNEQILELSEYFVDRQNIINIEIMKRIGKRMNELKNIDTSDIFALQNMYEMGAEMNDINSLLSKYSSMNIKDIEALYNKISKQSYAFSKKFYNARGITQIPFSENQRLQQYIQAMIRVTAGDMYNISNATMLGIKTSTGFMNIRSIYTDSVDVAIQAASQGTITYKDSIQGVVERIGSSGMRVLYPSGVVRRLDTVTRQNVLDGVRDLNQEIQNAIGEEIDADGIEISMHMNSAPDHMPYQGMQYTKKQFEYLQNSLDRSFGQWNCHHYMFNIVLGVSTSNYTRAEISEMNAQNKKGVTVDSTHYTMYDVSQKQRQLETVIRRDKERLALAEASGFTSYIDSSQTNLRQSRRAYREFSNAAGVKMRPERVKFFK